MNITAQDNYDFLKGGGEMGQLIRDYDWHSSPLGEPNIWPQALKTVVRLLLTTGHPMFIFWGSELIQFYNDAYRRSIGFERHPRALGGFGRQCWEEIWHIIGPQIDQVMAGGGYTWNENHLVPITRHGSYEEVYWTYSYSPIDAPDSPNGIGGVLVVCTETTEQVLAERSKKLAEARWRELFNQAPGFMCILTGPDHKFEFANPSYFELLGGRELVGKTVSEAIPEAVEQGFGELLDNVYQTGKVYNGFATPIILNSANGHAHRYLDFVYQPIRNAEGDVTGIFVDGYDVTERVLASETLRQEDRRKDEFLAMLAHELRNPLAPIRNASERLIQTSEQESDRRKIGDLISRQVTQLTHLVDDLLDVSRITQGQIELQQQPLELTRLLQFAIESIQPSVYEKHHDLALVIGKRLFVNGDNTRLTQCITNVLANAVKYTEPGGKIRVELSENNGMAIINIIDNGIGIAPDILPKIFDLFVQAERSLDRSQGGLGIGLSIVRRLIQMHGGSIKAISDGIGKGAIFQITLPLIDAPTDAITPNSAVDLLARRLLIVDDNIDAADSLTQLLQLKGHQVTSAYSARDALMLVNEFVPDVVLLDIGLPLMNGYEVARKIRSGDKNVVLIALTGYGQAKDIREAKEAGFDAHLTKPITFDHLEKVLADYLKK